MVDDELAAVFPFLAGAFGVIFAVALAVARLGFGTAAGAWGVCGVFLVLPRPPFVVVAFFFRVIDRGSWS